MKNQMIKTTEEMVNDLMAYYDTLTPEDKNSGKKMSEAMLQMMIMLEVEMRNKFQFFFSEKELKGINPTIIAKNIIVESMYIWTQFVLKVLNTYNEDENIIKFLHRSSFETFMYSNPKSRDLITRLFIREFEFYDQIAELTKKEKL